LHAYGVLDYSLNECGLNGTANADGGGVSFGLGIDGKVSLLVFVGAKYLRRDMYNGAAWGIDALDANLGTLSLRLGMSF
jgi:hypothetical protein